MIQKTALLLVLIIIISSTNIIGMEKSMDGKKAILVVSFGTSYAETRKKTIEACENKIKDTFKDFEVRRAFTSNMIRKILHERDGIYIDTVEEALTRLKNEAFNHVIIQPLHLLAGEEYHVKILTPALRFKDDFATLQIGDPVLAKIDDYDMAVDGILSELPKMSKKKAVLFMGHGTHHPSNASYSCLQLKVNEKADNIFIGTVEGYPMLDTIVPQLKKKRIKEVHLLPYMVVAGDHASNDMAGDEADSWKSILEKEGFKVTYELKGLGEYTSYQDLYVDHVKKALSAE